MDSDVDMAGADELEGFDDFTLASSWERLISEIEAICRMWQADGARNLLEKGAERVKALRNLYHVKADFTFGIKTYALDYFFKDDKKHGFKFENNITAADSDQWSDGLHFLQMWFGVKDFLIISPQSMSRVVLDAPEATKLLSAVAIALSNCGSKWPAFVPVHDPTRKAYKGIQNIKTTLIRRFEADRIGSHVPVKLMHLEGLYELFVSKLSVASTEFFTPFFQVHYTMRLTYKTPVTGYESEQHGLNQSESTETSTTADSDLFNKRQWDDDFPWSEWYSVEDPVKGFELIAIWMDKVVESSVEMAEFENVSTYEADKWFLVPITLPDPQTAGRNNQVGFASRLLALVEAFCISFNAQFMDDFSTVENPRIQKLTASFTVPPPTVLDRVLKDLFHEGPTISKFSSSCHKHALAIKGAPLESLFAQFCLHSLWFGSCNIRAISVLWIEFLREVRWCWEELVPLPRMASDGTIDLSCSLVHQKLQMLAVCINKKISERSKASNIIESKLREQGDAEVLAVGINKNILEGSKISNTSESKVREQQNAEVEELKSLERGEKCQHTSKDILDGERGRSTEVEKDVDNSKLSGSDLCNSFQPKTSLENGPLYYEQRGSAGPVGDMMLLKAFKRLHAPFTQDIPIMTQDMHEERQQAIEALSNTQAGKNLHAQLEKEILASDMSAFKAANPESVFEDFIRWHSPGDWVEDFLDEAMEGLECTDEKIKGIKSSWPPKGRLSDRMSESGNSWREIWNDAQAVPASEQKPLLDPDREGEKVLHYLETLRPHQLLGQMLCTAFRAAADTLNQTDFGRLKQMVLRVEQLYLTIASYLKPFQEGQISEDPEDLHGDLQRLCSVFEQIERLLFFAASLHQKLSRVPRLATVIFNDLFKHSMDKNQNPVHDLDEEFRIEQFVRMYERDSVAAIFSPPTPSQSWRKVLSMGNFLNGHEPQSREVVFSLYDSTGHRHYGGESLESTSTGLQTHMMYTCGTSNDLQVALSVTSSD
ncbi:uncharacterized protein LOC131071205 isoform X3 [Cryptomeria japonica]|uniref:uncharacterized protein LOC131071205 isoform X3 n=1 Tax=Cryptomeria japonica TaxID=3369 RepID=UPI0027D9DC07|nr:uncharacterized protein LOC131071205 isoform X3 [Cryptomeria japonica]